jgi:tRNA A22 N-methylase
MALNNGALALLQQVHEKTKDNGDEDSAGGINTNIPIEFRLGDGLHVVDQADIICIAGMGVHSMVNILHQEQSQQTRRRRPPPPPQQQQQQQLSAAETNAPDGEDSLTLSRIGCTRLILQPTNSRPRHLMVLYNRLQETGWMVEDERIEKLSSRWYITTSFRKQTQSNINIVTEEQSSTKVVLPGSILSTTLTSSHAMYQVFEEYCHHHTMWIEEDSKARRRIDPEEAHWLDHFRNQSPRVKI